MCRSIKKLYNVAPPASTEEIREAALQFVRKISGIRSPSKSNTRAFTQAVDHISSHAQVLLHALATTAASKHRDVGKVKRVGV